MEALEMNVRTPALTLQEGLKESDSEEWIDSRVTPLKTCIARRSSVVVTSQQCMNTNDGSRLYDGSRISEF